MHYARKKSARIRAWQLGSGSEMERELTAQGRIRVRADGQYELFSQEAKGGIGQHASAGDYFKVDSKGYPYPNSRDMFEQEHAHIGGDWYLQTARALPIWTSDEPQSEEIAYLISHGLLELHPETPQRYFRAGLWDTQESAARDAVVVFYQVGRDDAGAICQLDFNFVESSEFARTYEILSGDRNP